jgi:hypothetical protein
VPLGSGGVVVPPVAAPSLPGAVSGAGGPGSAPRGAASPPLRPALTTTSRLAARAPRPATRAMKQRLPPFWKKPSTAKGRLEVPSAPRAVQDCAPNRRRYSSIPVTSRAPAGPRSVSPTKPAVLVLTPSIGLPPISTSST